MNISFAITCYNEYEELDRLLKQVTLHASKNDEIVIQQDNYDAIDVAAVQVHNLCLDVKQNHSNLNIRYINYPLAGDFANFKNNLKNHCKKDYIFFLDADETVSENLIGNIHAVIEMNQVDLILVPRANTVKGLTQSHINKWKWRVENGLVNWPDFQGRIVKNSTELKWRGKVHEVIEGFKTLTQLPIDNFDWCLHHDKDIKKQEKQNSLYDNI